MTRSTFSRLIAQSSPAQRTHARLVAGAMTATVAAVLLVTGQAWAAGHGGAAATHTPAAQPPSAAAAASAPQSERGRRDQTGQMRHHGMTKGGDASMGAGHHRMMGMGIPGKYLERMLEQVQATPEQRNAIRAAMTRHRDQQRPIYQQGHALHQEALALWAQPAIDERAAERLRMRMNAHHQQMSAANMGLMLEVGRILTPEQRAQMAQQLRERHGKQPRQPGGAQ